MTDLTNRSVNEVNGFIQLYTPLLEYAGIKHNNDVPILAITFDVSIKYIKEKYDDLSKDWKSWSVFVVKKKYFDSKIKTEEDIRQTIDDFVEFWKSEYKNYCDDTVAATEYDRDRGFVYGFLNKNR